MITWAVGGAKVKPEFGPVPEGVEVCRRVDAIHTVFVLINHGGTPAEIALPEQMKDVLAGGMSVTRVRLEPQGVALLETSAPGL